MHGEDAYPANAPAEDLETRIESVFDEAAATRRMMIEHQREVLRLEADAKLEHRDEWAGAKNNDVRAVLLAEWLAENEEYRENRGNYDTAREEFRISMLEVERLRLLVAARGVGA